MVSHYELALLSKQAYFSQPGIVLGWERKNFYDRDGLSISVFCNQKNDMVYAFRGTDTIDLSNLMFNLKSNFDILIGNVPISVNKAKDLVASIRSNRGLATKFLEVMQHLSFSKVYLVGHSLGGVIAGLVAFEYIKMGKKYNVVTFENPGFGHLIPHNDLTTYSSILKERFVSYLGDPNPINTLYPHVGVIRRVRMKAYNNNVLDKFNHHFKYTIDCVSNDILRVLLLLIFADLILSLFLKKNIISDGNRRGLQSISRQGSRYIDVPSIDYAENLQILILLVKFIAITVFAKLLNKIVSNIQKQHPIESMIAELAKVDKKNIIEMERWPNSQQYYSSHAKHLLNWWNPLQHPSVINVNCHDQLHEDQIKNIEGYHEKR